MNKLSFLIQSFANPLLLTPLEREHHYPSQEGEREKDKNNDSKDIKNTSLPPPSSSSTTETALAAAATNNEIEQTIYGQLIEVAKECVNFEQEVLVSSDLTKTMEDIKKIPPTEPKDKSYYVIKSTGTSNNKIYSIDLLKWKETIVPGTFFGSSSSNNLTPIKRIIAIVHRNISSYMEPSIYNTAVTTLSSSSCFSGKKENKIKFPLPYQRSLLQEAVFKELKQVIANRQTQTPKEKEK